MKVSLQLKLGQQLTMTPQLQQAIRLLQLSTLDLQQEIQEALESNPMLELHDDDSRNNESAEIDAQTNNNDNNNDQTNNLESDDYHQNNSDSSSSESINSSEKNSDDWSDSIPDDLPVDTVWEDIYPNNTPSSGSSSEDDIEVAYVFGPPTVDFGDDITICEGENITIFDKLVTSEEVVRKTFAGANGCDSTHAVQVTMLQSITTEEATTICALDCVDCIQYVH